MKKIAFYTPHLAITGGPVSIYDYADYNEKILGNKSIIIYDNDFYPDTHPDVVKKFENRFEHIFKIYGDNNSNYPNFYGRNDWHWNSHVVNPLLDKIIEEEKCDAIFMNKIGLNDGIVSSKCKTFIQCLGTVCQPHGDVYSYCSDWLGKFACNNKYPTVPFMVSPLPVTNENLRSELNIPEDAIVFGRYGGDGSWSGRHQNVDLTYASSIICKIVEEYPKLFFIFMNTPQFSNHPNIKFLPASSNYLKKSIFINTCDAMIHARPDGEGFGLACGEFASKNKPIITCSASKERFHIELVENYGGYLYNSPEELYKILTQFKKEPEKNWNIYRDYTPEKVMEIFKKIYLDTI